MRTHFAAAAAAAFSTLSPAQDFSDAFELPEGLQVTQWAESPQLYNPTAMDIDVRGRVWVTEAVNYRQWNGRNPGMHRDGGDRVVILEDTDGDGVCDSSKVFVQDPALVAPLGIALVDRRVYVSCSPNLFVYIDDDGDDVADRRETVLTGFGGFDHDHGLHSVVPYRDRLYVAIGNAGPHIVEGPDGFTLRSGSIYDGGGPARADNKPGLVSSDGKVWTGGLVLSFNFDGSGMRVEAHNFRNPYEVAFDLWGDMFIADNDDDGNQACRTTWVMPGGNYGYFSADGARMWQADRRPGQGTQTAHWHQDDPGVAPMGTINGGGGPTGVAAYGGKLLAPWIAECVLNCDAGARVVYAHRKLLSASGVALAPGYLIRAAPDASGQSGQWFRPSDVCVGPAGDVYVCDWYDPGVGGHAMGDRAAYGRILRIQPEGANVRPPVLDLANPNDLRVAAGLPSVAARALARARGVQGGGGGRGGAGFEPTQRRKRAYKLRFTPFEGDALEEMIALAGAYDGQDRWYLETLGIMFEGREEAAFAELSAAFGDTPLAWDARFEGLAWRLHTASAVPAFLARAMSPTLDEAARRRAIDALAFSPGRAAADAVVTAATAGPEDLRGYALWWLQSRDANDWRSYSLLAGLANGDLRDAQRAYTSGVMREGLVDIDVDLAGAEKLWLVVTDGGNGNSYDWAAWIAPRLVMEDGRELALAGNWLAASAEWGSVNVDRDPSGGPLEVGDQRFERGIGAHARSEIAFAVPAGARRLLAQAGPEKGGTDQVNGTGTSVEFQVYVQRADAPQPLLEWNAIVADDAAAFAERRAAAEALGADPRGALLLIQAREAGQLADALVEPVAAALFKNPDLGVRALASQHFPRPGGGAVPSIAALMQLEGDPTRGRELYMDSARAQCITCHAFQMGDTRLGADLGPELTQIRRKLAPDALFDAILNPSAGIAFGYDTYIVQTSDGLLYSGFLLADGPTLSLLGTNGERVTLDAADVVAKKKQTTSTMPEGVALDLAPQDLADLVAFLSQDQAHEPEFGPELALFDGGDMGAWTFHLSDPTKRFEDVWSVQDGVLRCEGNPAGYIRTKEEFTNYRLTLEWRFDPARGAGNSGVLLRRIGEDKVWPRSIEAQLQSGNAGDFWNIDEFPMRADPRRTSGRHTERSAPSSEKPLGEWNRYDILVDGPRVELRVNGVLQNAADWCAEVPGHICLQSEGAYIEFRDVRLTPIVR
ncbi:MAG: family 16 glycoside hydrolase [Planctomycetota bacterium]